MPEIIVSVRDKNNTYTAKVGKVSASCTGGAEQAVGRLAEKLFGTLQRVNLVFLERIGLGEEEWSIKPDLTQRCRVCGCDWDHGCDQGQSGYDLDTCYWVEADLCSCCVDQGKRP